MAKKESFEASLTALEKIVEKLGDGAASLEEALKLFEQGRGHSKFCETKLNEVERKIQVLLENERGEPVVQPFEESEQEAADSASAHSSDDFPG